MSQSPPTYEDDKTLVSAVEQSATIYDNERVRKLTRKIDLHLIPPLFLIWFFPFIDRVNIGNARIQGLEKDLHMTGNQFNVAIVVFFIPLILFEAPSNIGMKRISPRIWLGGQTLLLGIFTLCQGLVRTYGGLIAMRVFVGLFEAGLTPGSVFLFAAYYPRFQLQWRLSLLMCSSALASAFGGLLAYAIVGMAGTDGYLGWRWIFIIEGLISVAIGLYCLVAIPNWPDKATFLNDEDRKLVKTRVFEGASQARMDHLDASAVKRSFRDWKIWLNAVIFIGTCATTYSVDLFGPTLVQTLYPHFSPRHVQILVVPILLVSGLSTATAAYLSDRLQHRFAFAQFGYLVSFIGFVILLCQEHVPKGVTYAALFFVEAGSYVSLSLLWSMMANNVSGKYKTAIATGLQIGLGNSGGIVTSLVFPASEAPLYRTGFTVCLALLVMAALLMVGFIVGLKFENEKRRRGERDYRFQLPQEEVCNLGDDHPEFRFVY